MILFDPERKAPSFESVPKHIAVVMDGNGRWANKRGLTRTEGHRAGEAALLEVIAGAIEAGGFKPYCLRVFHRELEALARRGSFSNGVQQRGSSQKAGSSESVGRSHSLVW